MIVTLVVYLNSSYKCSGQPVTGNKELQVKAAFIYNFTKFVYWDAQEKDVMPTAITISVLDSDPIGDILENFSKDNSNDTPIIVKRVSAETNPVTDCQLLFIMQSEQRRLPALLKQLEGTKILTVSDISEFARRGGMIGFILEDDRLKIEMNLNTINKAGLKISAKLIEIARIVK
jgi:hypothetical protein